MSSRVLADDLVAVAQEAAAIDLRSFEERDRTAVRKELVPRVLRLVERGVEGMDRVLALHDEPASGDLESGHAPEYPDRGENFFVSIDRVVGAARDRSTDAADLAFMARMELRETAAALNTIGSEEDRWRLLGVCDSCLRGLRKASSAVERALACHGGFAPRLEFVTELHMGRVIRAYYARFRREIERGGEPTRETVHRRLLSAAASMAKLIGRDFYGELRVDDRAELRRLQERMRSWLGGEDGHDPESGIRLWQDLQGFTVLLGEINRRSELVEHDRDVVREALPTLEALDPATDALPGTLRQRLESLRGRSDRIDELLASARGGSPGPWLEELQRLARNLDTGSTSQDDTGCYGPPGAIEW